MSTEEKVKAEGGSGSTEHIVLRVRDQTGEEIQFKVRGAMGTSGERGLSCGKGKGVEGGKEGGACVGGDRKRTRTENERMRAREKYQFSVRLSYYCASS